MAVEPAPNAARRPMSVQRRMSALIALCAGLTALLGLLAVVGTGWWLQQDHAREDVRETAGMLAYTLQAPLAFDDRKGIADALGVLGLRPEISAAWVFDARGGVIASIGQAAAQAPGARGGGLLAGHMIDHAPVIVDGQALGSVVIVNELSHLWQLLGIAALAVGLGSAAGFGVSVLLARRIARTITQPIATLAEASRAVAASHDYSLRLPQAGDDEIGTAIGAFNAMLEEIRDRGEALQAANRHLEVRVAERTEALRAEKERAEAASVAKTRFLANMSHELRTPLNAVIGAAQLLQAGGDDPETQAHLVASIRNSGVNLLGLIENILDLSRIETGALELVNEDFNLLDCVEAALATASVAARAKGLEIACIVDPALPAWRHGDPMRLRQVLLNLLGNAVKFTPAGEVVLRVGPGETPLALDITVSDTGIGIGEVSLGVIFEPFRQADDASNRRFGGSGLGLAITRQLVEAMGGRIAVRSGLGKGSVFEIALTLAAARRPPADPAPLRQRIVYFEPHEASALALAAQLERLGCTARRCRSARELRAWLGAPVDGPDKPWLLAAVDAPETWSFLEESIASIDPERVIGMTASESHAAEMARERFHVPRNVIKPVLRSALVSRLGAVIRPPGSAPVAAAGGEGKHVLVVEDDVLNQTIVCSMLANAGYRTTVAADGTQALARLGREAFDVVLMDWQMPDMDGLEITRRLRAGACGRFGKLVPIIALTANAFAEDRAACLAAGMNDFLSKPVLAASLVAAVARWTAAPAAAPAPTPSYFSPLI